MRVADFHSGLPEALIVCHSLPERRASHLLALDDPTGTPTHRQLTDPLDYLRPGDLMVFNNTRAVPACLFSQEESGGKLRILIEHMLNQHQVPTHIRANKVPKPGMRVLVEGSGSVEMLQCHDTLSELVSAESMLSLLERVGHMPSLPYINRPDGAADRRRYQTVYAQRAGAMATPIAGLHFDEALLEATRTRGVDAALVTLHAGTDTFQSVRVEHIEGHVMHREWLEVSQNVVDAVLVRRARGGRVVVAGTTSVRSLESAARDGKPKPFSSGTNIFIFPDRPLHVVDALVTNFYLPESTLLMLVSVFVGYPEAMAAYTAAIVRGYHFFSHGNAMLIARNPAPRGPGD